MFNINTPLRINHFLSQCLHESINLTVLKENLNYSAEGLVKTFKKYFPTIESTNGYVRNQAKIANKVYSNRMGNLGEDSGMGFKFRGRSVIQVTGHDNYAQLSKDTKIDFIKNPELLETLEYAFLGGGWFWNRNNLNLIADKGNTDEIIKSITKRVNGGYNGIEDRIIKFRKCEKIIK
jgi:putative chitinase